ncbi:hypothetical protein FK498_08770 [Elioraea sp. Yellowstone]|jgi:hypothetical protein|nr:hypothetical protein FK498_08770 [Elioraea sp. Yellowstone]
MPDKPPPILTAHGRAEAEARAARRAAALRENLRRRKAQARARAAQVAAPEIRAATPAKPGPAEG